jgi:hypothetical protein
MREWKMRTMTLAVSSDWFFWLIVLVMCGVIAAVELVSF